MPPRFAWTAALVAVHLNAVPASAALPQTESQAEARRLSDAFAAVAEKVSSSVVQVEVAVREEEPAATRWYRGSGTSTEMPVQRGVGSGVVFNKDGAILTNNHVVEDALSIAVRLRDGRLLPASLVGRDPSTDLALIHVEAKDLTPATFADSDAARVGEWVLAIGSPFGLGYTVTTGVVSAKGRGAVGVNAVEDYLQTDASINPGNSGGPLVNLDGQVLGINTMIVGRGQGIGFAVPSNLARRAAEQLVKTGRVHRGWLGIGIQDVTPELAPELGVETGAGALVNSVAADGPGARARLRAGDIIAAIDGKRVRDAQEFVRELYARDVGQSLYLEVVRAGRHYGASAALAQRPEPPLALAPVQQDPARTRGLGVLLRDLPATSAVELGLGPRPVAQVTQVTPGSAADRAGLRPGDVVVEADGVTEPTTAQIAQAGQKGHMLLRIRRRNATFYAAVRR
jgi:Do/DeqQ family serine protease